MGFMFRKSANFGPFRLNLSKSGVGWSVGGRGFRTGNSATGRKYSTFGIPGTGIGYRSSKGCMMFVAPFVLLAIAVGYASILRWNYA